MFWSRNILATLLQKDALVVLLGLFIGSYGLVHFFKQVSLTGETSAVAEFGLKPGKSNMCLVTPDGNVGTMELQLDQSASGLVVKTQGNVKLKFQEKLYDPSFSLDSEFSVLGQLVTFLLRVKLGTDELMIGFLEINPITVSVILNRAGSMERHGFTIPGPFELREQRAGTYRLFYAPFQGGASNALMSSFIQSARQKLPLSVVQKKNCEIQQVLDVTPVAQYVQATVTSLSRWLPVRSYQN